MRALRLFLCLEIAFLLLALAGVALGAEQPQEIIIENLTPQSEVIYDYSKGIGWGTNGVIIRYTNAVLTAHAAMVNIDSGEAQAEGDVTLQRQGEIWRGERLLYNFKTHEMQAEHFRTGRMPFFAAGENLSINTTNKTYVLSGALLTTDDVADPAYKIRARTINI